MSEGLAGRQEQQRNYWTGVEKKKKEGRRGEAGRKAARNKSPDRSVRVDARRGHNGRRLLQ